MTGKWIYAGAIALMALCTERAAAQQEIVLHDVNGKEMKAALRKALPVEAPRVRYPGFKQETLVLKKGSIRREGTRPLPCDILMERDVPVKLRDGVTIYTGCVPSRVGRGVSGYPGLESLRQGGGWTDAGRRADAFGRGQVGDFGTGEVRGTGPGLLGGARICGGESGQARGVYVGRQSAVLGARGCPGWM